MITTTKELKAFCKRQKNAEFITVDMEFIRDKTYYPNLCLVQVGGINDEAVCIDPLAKEIDMKPLWDLMLDPKILKVMHAGRQDIEIFYLATGKIPTPYFDTQIAAMVCGYGESVGYQTLVRKITQNDIDKTSRFTDWARRPLSDKQVKYALSDVTHLRDIYLALSEEIKKEKRQKWVEEEEEILLTPDTYENPPEHAWERIKLRTHKPIVISIVREVARWREEQAQEQNVPRNRIFKDEACVELAANRPKTVEELRQARHIYDKIYKNAELAESLLAAIEKGINTPKDQIPKPIKKPSLPPGIGPTVELFKVLLKLKCESHHVAAKLIANASDLELMAADDKAKVRCLKGWRKEIFGNDALALKHGKLALSVENNEIKLVKI